MAAAATAAEAGQRDDWCRQWLLCVNGTEDVGCVSANMHIGEPIWPANMHIGEPIWPCREVRRGVIIGLGGHQGEYEKQNSNYFTSKN